MLQAGVFSQPVRQPGNAHAAEQGRGWSERMELGCPKHCAGRAAEQERQYVFLKNKETNQSLGHLELTFKY